MTALAITMLATTNAATDGISPRLMTLLMSSIIAGLVGGVLGFIVSAGTQNQRLAAGVIAGVIAFAGTYKFLDGLVLSQSTNPAGPTPSSATTPSLDLMIH